jgi:hypothetical protein
MDTEPLSYELERALLHALLEEWHGINDSLFHRRMGPPVVALFDGDRLLGRWVSALRRLELSRPFALAERWTAVLEVLKHEMAHQFVDEVLRIHEQTAHGEAFQRVCSERGIDPRAAGVPAVDGSPEQAPERAAVLSKVAKLLALAQSPNEHEAQAAMNLAQRLMLTHNLGEIEARRAQRYISRELGQPVGRIEESIGLIGVVLQQHFFVEVIQIRVHRVREGTRGTVLEVSGTPDNVAMAEYVYSFLHHTAEALWSQHKRSRGIRGDRDRRAYRAGVMQGFLAKLRAEKKLNESNGLVWLGDPALQSFYRKRYPRISTVRTGGAGSASARSEGQEAGRKIVLARGVEGGGSTSRGLALGPGDKR